jgi:diacylglycerol kinase (ATP)
MTMIGVVLNRNALGVMRDHGLGVRLARVLGGDGQVVETRTADELAGAIARFAERGCELVASCGGDGTSLATATELVRRYGADDLPRFAFLRGGTVNTVAESLGVRGRPDELLARIVARRRTGEPFIETGQDLIEVRFDGIGTPGQPEAKRVYGFLFAAAMGARFLEAYYGGPRPGVAWATLLAMRTAASTLLSGRLARWLFEPLPVELIADGERAPIERVRLLLASTIPSVGIGFKVTWQGGQQPNRFHLVASAIPLPSMALQLPRVLAGRPLDGAPHIDRLVQTLDVRFEDAETFTLDGELFRAREVHLRVGPRLWVVRA